MEGNVRGIQMKKEFVMRGQTASGLSEVLNFSGYKPGYAYRMTEFTLYPSTNVLGQNVEMCGTVTASKTAEDPENPNYNNAGLIGTTITKNDSSHTYAGYHLSVVNDTFLITQNLKLLIKDAFSNPVNWQCRFVSVKMNDAEEAATNFKQFTISDE